MLTLKPSTDSQGAGAAMQPPALLYSSLPLPPLETTPERDLAPEIAHQAAARAAAYTDADLATLAPHIDIDFYRARHPDIRSLDPVAHFHESGWREGRDPNTWFDVAWYLRAYPDVAAAGLDPFLHYLVNGRAEGRQPAPPGGRARAIVDAAIAPQDRVPGYDAPANAAHLDADGLTETLAAACLGAKGLVLSVSHDRYTDVTGGIQIFIADEQTRFNADRGVYLHISPAIARLTLDAGHDGPGDLQIVLDGEFFGLIPPEELETALAALPKTTAPARLFILHSLFGHRWPNLAALSKALGASSNFFWLHDYATVCEGYNLLRDDLVFCGAPPASSMQCRICVYGAHRPAWHTSLRALFSLVPFHVLAPSQAALDIWQRGSNLPHRSARVHPNATFGPDTPSETSAAPVRSGPVRIAFVGYPIPHKGWPLFLDLVRQLRPMPDLQFFHFSHPKTLVTMDGLTPVATQVDPDNRFATVDALAAHQIDLVLMLSPWPETFSYVTHEAFAAGADVVTLAVAGNIPDAVRRHARGIVLRDEAALLRFLRDGHAAHYAALRRAAPPPHGTLHLTGTTATLDLADHTSRPHARLQTADPDPILIANGQTIRPTRNGDRYSFNLPPDAGDIRLISRHHTPGAATNAERDLRRLGLAIRTLHLDDTDIPAGHPARLSGWHGAGTPGHEWTSGDATIAAAAATTLTITLAPIARYEVAPLVRTT